MTPTAGPRSGRGFGPLARRLVVGCLVLAPTVASAQEAYVTAQLANEVAVVDLGTRQVSARIAVDGAPAGIALSPDRSRAYVTRPEGGGIAIIDLRARRVLRTLSVPGGPLGIAVDPVSGSVFVADWYSARVLVLEPSAEGASLVGEIGVGRSPSGLAVTPDGATLLVANREANSVSIVDIASRREVAVVPVGEHPFGLTLSPDGHRAFTANVVSDDVSVVDVRERREIGRVRAGRRPYVVALDAERGYVTNQDDGSVTVFDARNLTVVKTVEVGDHPEGIAISRDGRSLFVANWGDNTLSVFGTADLDLIARISVPDGPRAFGDFLR